MNNIFVFHALRMEAASKKQRGRTVQIFGKLDVDHSLSCRGGRDAQMIGKMRIDYASEAEHQRIVVDFIFRGRVL